jgi:N-acetylated-alpha-linked acidic dipeptidase
MRTVIAPALLVVFTSLVVAQTPPKRAQVKGESQETTAERKPRNKRPDLTADEELLVRTVTPAMARRHLKALTEHPHLAGTPGDWATAMYVKKVLDEAGFETDIEEYHVLLPSPVSVSLELTKPVRVPLDLREQPFPWKDDSLAKHPSFLTFNGYSPSGTVEAEVVYAQYGRSEDFDWLESKGVSIKGKICLIRYGKIFRGLKVREADKRGAAGVLLYSEPDDDGYRKGDVYPNGPYRPKTGVQRGSIMYISELVGDPLTPGRPATKDAVRLKREECTWLPKIPCMPISWGNALRILEHVKGHNVPKDWQGGCPTTYHTGPGPVQVKMKVVMDEKVQPIWNVIGRLRTKKTTDKYVLIGNHRDGWVYGAIDPNTGSAVTLEAMRALGELVKKGWHPRVEVRYASWDGEEQGLIGSVEHAEDHREDLQANCLAYFNCDAAVSGGRFSAKSTPELVGVLAYAAARTMAHDGKGRILTRWARGGTRPPVGNLGSGSDYTAFLCHLGIPAFDFGSKGGHGVYHSMFDNFETVSKYLDPGFKIHASVARFLAIATHHFASAAVPPIDLAAIAPYLKSCAGTLRDLPEHRREALLAAIDAFAEVALAHPASEAKMIAMHHAFLDPEGLQNRPWYRNLIVAPGRDLGYGATVMPGIAEALADQDAVRAEHELRRMIGCIEKATAIMKQ